MTIAVPLPEFFIVSQVIFVKQVKIIDTFFPPVSAPRATPVVWPSHWLQNPTGYGPGRKKDVYTAHCNLRFGNYELRFK